MTFTSLIPQPVSMTAMPGAFKLTEDTVILHGPAKALKRSPVCWGNISDLRPVIRFMWRQRP